MTGFADLLPRKDLSFPFPSLPPSHHQLPSSSAASQGWGWPRSCSPLICGAGTRGHRAALRSKTPPRGGPFPPQPPAPQTRAALFLPALICLSPRLPPSRLAASSPAAPHPDACLCLSAPAREPLRSEAGRLRCSPLPSALLNHGCLPAPRKPHAPKSALGDLARTWDTTDPQEHDTRLS